jgi:hypothetical protein
MSAMAEPQEGSAPERRGAVHASGEAPERAAGTSPVTYGAYYYEHDCGIPYERNEHWMRFFGGIAERIVKDFQPRYVLDAGCAMGLLVEQLFVRGVDAHGIDISKYAISQVHESVADRCRVGSLVEPLERRYDLVVCLEVVEHLWPDEARTVIANLCGSTDRLLFSSTPLDYKEPTHLNVQPPEYWSALLAEHGLFRNLDYDATFVAPWAALYERQSTSPRDIVRHYDRAYSRLREEIGQLRASLVEMHETLERYDPGRPEPIAAGLDEREHTIRQLREQLLALRDTVIGLEAVNGQIAGERDLYFAQLAAQRAAVEQLEAVRASRSWRLTWKLLAPYRRLRRMFGR